MNLRRVIVAVGLALAACSSPAPLRLHTLMPADLPPAAAAPVLAVEVLPVGVPAALDQQQIVLREGSGRLALLERERWGAPLGEELRAALAASLSRALNARDVTGLPRPADAAVLRIKVEVRRFESQPGAQALIEADWSVTRGTDQPRLLCRSEQRVAAGAGTDGVVQAHQQAVQGLARDIAVSARNGSC